MVALAIRRMSKNAVVVVDTISREGGVLEAVFHQDAEAH